MLKKPHTFGQVMIAFAQSMRTFCCKNLSCELFEIQNLKFVSIVGKSSPFCSPARHHHHHHLPSHWAGFSDQPTPTPTSRVMCAVFFCATSGAAAANQRALWGGSRCAAYSIREGIPHGRAFCCVQACVQHTVCANRQRDTGRGGREIRGGDEESTMSE